MYWQDRYYEEEENLREIQSLMEEIVKEAEGHVALQNDAGTRVYRKIRKKIVTARGKEDVYELRDQVWQKTREIDKLESKLAVYKEQDESFAVYLNMSKETRDKYMYLSGIFLTIAACVPYYLTYGFFDTVMQVVTFLLFVALIYGVYDTARQHRSNFKNQVYQDLKLVRFRRRSW